MDDSIICCQICSELFSDLKQTKRPKTLHCGHTYCSACVEKLKKDFQKCSFCMRPVDSKTEFADSFQLFPYIAKVCGECGSHGDELHICKHCEYRVCSKCEPKHFDAYRDIIIEEIDYTTTRFSLLKENGRQIKHFLIADLEFAKMYKIKRICKLKCSPEKFDEIVNTVSNFISQHEKAFIKNEEECDKIKANYDSILLLKNEFMNFKDKRLHKLYESHDIFLGIKQQQVNQIADNIDLVKGKYNVKNPITENFKDWLLYELDIARFNANFNANMLFEYLKNDLQGKNGKIQVSVVVFGRSGVGKSSFINTLRGLKPDHIDAIKVGLVESTNTITPYTFLSANALENDNFTENVIVWDTPGVATPEFKVDNCKKEIVDPTKADAFVYIYEAQFNEKDKQVLDILRKKNKPIFICRSKVDNDFKRTMEKKFKKYYREIPKQTREEEYEDTFRILNDIYLKDKAKNQYLCNERVFFISTDFDYRDKFEYNEFISHLINSLPSIQSNLLLSIIRTNSLELLKQKRDLIQNQIESTVKTWVMLQDSAEDLKRYLNCVIQEYARCFGIHEMTKDLFESEAKELLNNLSVDLACQLQLPDDKDSTPISDDIKLGLMLITKFHLKNMGMKNAFIKHIVTFLSSQLELIYSKAVDIFSGYHIHKYEELNKKQ